eukprot:jgi/Ulvmu1/9199/UM005_0299.1
MANLGSELAMVGSAFAIYLAYHISFFMLYGSGLRTTKVWKREGEAAYNDMFNRGKIARIHFSQMICEENDTICGIQQNRNGLIAVSFLAGTASLLAQKVLSILLTEEQLEQIERYGSNDPVLGGTGVPPFVILGINFVVLMMAMLSFAQAVRMFVHSGYFFKAGALASSWVTVADVAEVSVHAQVAQTIGLRTLYLFPVTALWLLGPTAMLISSVVTTGVVAFLDFNVATDSSLNDVLREVTGHPNAASV